MVKLTAQNAMEPIAGKNQNSIIIILPLSLMENTLMFHAPNVTSLSRRDHTVILSIK